MDEFAALTVTNSSPVGACVQGNFQDTCYAIAKVGFRVFLGVAADVVNISEDGLKCQLLLRENPLVQHVELPAEFQGFEEPLR